MKEKYLKCLDLFVSNDDMKYNMKHPFYQEQYVISTDAHTAIFIDGSFVEGVSFVKSGNPPNAIGILPKDYNMDVEFDFSLLLDCLLNAKKIEKDTYVRKDKKCEDCKGRGEVEFEFRDKLYKEYTIESDCPVCEGVGKLTAFECLKNGEIISEYQVLIKIKSCFYDYYLVERLAKACEILGVDKIRIRNFNENTKLTLFEVGATKIIIMPLHYDNENHPSSDNIKIDLGI